MLSRVIDEDTTAYPGSGGRLSARPEYQASVLDD